MCQERARLGGLSVALIGFLLAGCSSGASQNAIEIASSVLAGGEKAQFVFERESRGG
jgi:hypothetical protein